MSIELSPDQRKVYVAIRDWMASGCRRQPLLTVGGLAGTGKSTLVSYLAANSPGELFAFVCYTGRAASVLRRKFDVMGVPTTSRARTIRGEGCHRLYADDSLPESGGVSLCSTIHQLLYQPIIDPVTEELREPYWKRRKTLDREYGFIVIDESSMVGDRMLRDIQHHGIPVLAVGDHGQLPPVMERGDLMANPMLRLEKIHRQAEKSPIIALSRHIRDGGRLQDFRVAAGSDPSAVRFVTADSSRLTADVTKRVIVEAYRNTRSLDVGILCWRNHTRVRLNGLVRTTFGLEGSPPQKSETVICLENHPPVYNGMRGILTKDAKVREKPPWILDAQVEFPDDGVPAERYELCVPQFYRENKFESLDELLDADIDVGSMSAAGQFFDFGYALTTHKSQGSQFAHTIVFLDRFEKPGGEDWTKWAYTSVTRASEKLSVILQGEGAPSPFSATQKSGLR